MFRILGSANTKNAGVRSTSTRDAGAGGVGSNNTDPSPSDTDPSFGGAGGDPGDPPRGQPKNPG
ncbi:hypothetical protein TWF173_003977 [Orbilia oligospora]|nr:hypothetical protein TWF173_003977 [Orbilia oligospora]